MCARERKSSCLLSSATIYNLLLFNIEIDIEKLLDVTFFKIRDTWIRRLLDNHEEMWIAKIYRDLNLPRETIPLLSEDASYFYQVKMDAFHVWRI